MSLVILFDLHGFYFDQNLKSFKLRKFIIDFLSNKQFLLWPKCPTVLSWMGLTFAYLGNCIQACYSLGVPNQKMGLIFQSHSERSCSCCRSIMASDRKRSGGRTGGEERQVQEITFWGNVQCPTLLVQPHMQVVGESSGSEPVAEAGKLSTTACFLEILSK